MLDRKTMQIKERLIPGKDWGRKRRLRFVVQYGMHKIGCQMPYFSITADVLSNGHMIAGGCMHEDIARYFPSLRPLIKWHLANQDGIPMHYVENAVFHWERYNEGMDSWEKFTHSALWGLLPEDKKIKLSRLRLAHSRNTPIRNILKWRLPKLQEAFHDCMRQFGVRYIK